MNVKIKKLNVNATIPVWNNKSAGCDLSSTEFHTLIPGERKLFKTGLSIAIPSGLYGRIAPRSGLAFKHGIDVMAGVIDEDYRGEVGVILINLGREDKTIYVGDKIAQLIFENYTRCGFEEVNSLDETNRGAGGYGSTDRLLHPKDVTESSVFKIGEKVNISTHASIIPYCLRQHDGEIYNYTEGKVRGFCVVDGSGTVLTKLELQ